MSQLFHRGKKETRFLNWISKKPAGHRFASRDVAKELNLMPYDVGRIAGILAEEGRLAARGRNECSATIWEVIPV